MQDVIRELANGYRASCCGQFVYSKYQRLKIFSPMKHRGGKNPLYKAAQVNGKLWLMHRLVATLFVKNPRPDIFDWVDHIDRNPENNHWTNLRWVSAELNHMNREGVPCGLFQSRYQELTGLASAGVGPDMYLKGNQKG